MQILKNVRNSKKGLVGVTYQDEKFPVNVPEAKAIAYPSSGKESRFHVAAWIESALSICGPKLKQEEYIHLRKGVNFKDGGIVAYNIYRKRE